jgi:hypothetical protein
MIAAGVNAKALSTYMGHASISITLDRYGHLMPGSEDGAVALVDAYLERTTGTHWRAGHGDGFAEPFVACLENRFGRFRPTRVQIPPPPLEQAEARSRSGFRCLVEPVPAPLRFTA